MVTRRRRLARLESSRPLGPAPSAPAAAGGGGSEAGSSGATAAGRAAHRQQDRTRSATGMVTHTYTSGRRCAQFELQPAAAPSCTATKPRQTARINAPQPTAVTQNQRGQAAALTLSFKVHAGVHARAEPCLQRDARANPIRARSARRTKPACAARNRGQGHGCVRCCAIVM